MSDTKNAALESTGEYLIGNPVARASLHYVKGVSDLHLFAVEGDEVIWSKQMGTEDAVAGAVHMIRAVRTNLITRGMHLDATYQFTELDFIENLSQDLKG